MSRSSSASSAITDRTRQGSFLMGGVRPSSFPIGFPFRWVLNNCRTGVVLGQKSFQKKLSNGVDL
jgi:hypothetical protein